MKSNCNCPYRTTAFCTYPHCQTNAKKKGKYPHIKAGRRTIAGREIYFRSRWEANFARILQWHIDQGDPFQGHHITSWDYEPKTFWFDESAGRSAMDWWKEQGKKKTLKGLRSGTNSWKVDFRVTAQKPPSDGLVWTSEWGPVDNTYELWYEVKGQFRARDNTKINRMHLYYPWIHVEFISSQFFRMNQIYSSFIKDWERG